MNGVVIFSSLVVVALLALVDMVVCEAGRAKIPEARIKAERSVRRRVGWLRLTWCFRRPFIARACRESMRRQAAAEGEATRAYKWAFVVRGTQGGLLFMPYGAVPHLAYTARAKARCPGWSYSFSYAIYRCSEVPGPATKEHKCGFHAVERAEDLGRVKDAYPSLNKALLASLVLLEVDLYGLIKPGKWGYRAAEQWVMKVNFGRRCAQCSKGWRPRRATALTYLKQYVNGGTYTLVVPACARHASPKLSLATVKGALGTGVAWK